MSYREMLRDRCPIVVNYALKWQGVKERWIDHVYTHFVKIYSDQQERYRATRICLGMAKRFREFKFDLTIDWDNLSDEEKRYWKRISSWVDWFIRKHAYIKNAYELSEKAGKSEFEIKVELINNWLSALLPSEIDTQEVKQAKLKYLDKFVDFLIKTFKKESK